jgi:hypothetical protein
MTVAGIVISIVVGFLSFVFGMRYQISRQFKDMLNKGTSTGVGAPVKISTFGGKDIHIYEDNKMEKIINKLPPQSKVDAVIIDKKVNELFKIEVKDLWSLDEKAKIEKEYVGWVYEKDISQFVGRNYNLSGL